MNLQPPDGTAQRLPAGWWALTPPSHPCSFERSFSSSGSSCHQLLALSPVERPMLPGLSSRVFLDTSDRPEHCFQGAKLRIIIHICNKMQGKVQKKHHFALSFSGIFVPLQPRMENLLFVPKGQIVEKKNAANEKGNEKGTCFRFRCLENRTSWRV